MGLVGAGILVPSSWDDAGGEARKGIASASFRAPICSSMRSLVDLPVWLGIDGDDELDRIGISEVEGIRLEACFLFFLDIF